MWQLGGLRSSRGRPSPAARFAVRSSVGCPAAPPPALRPRGRLSAGPQAAMAPPEHRSWVEKNGENHRKMMENGDFTKKNWEVHGKL